MAVQPVPITSIKLTTEQEKEGYWLEERQDRLMMWHKKNQIDLLNKSPGIGRKVQETIERRRSEPKKIEEKTGWKSN